MSDNDDLREMLTASVKEAEGKVEGVVESAAKLEPVVPIEPVVAEVKAPEVKETVEPGEEAPTTEATTETKETTSEPILAQDKAPSSWNPKVREMWATLPKEVRDEIVRREDAGAAGVRKLQAEVEPMRGFVQQLEPFIQEALNGGSNPGQYIGQVMAAERALRSPDENARFEALLAIADSYRIPLREVINASVGREVIAAQPKQAPQTDPSVQRELQAQRQWREEQEQKTLIAEIETFKAANEFFEDVRPMMANMITANPSMSLKDAYDAAIWANPATREVLQKRASKTTELAKKQAAAAGTSLSPSGTIPVRTKLAESETSLEDDLRESIAAAAGRA